MKDGHPYPVDRRVYDKTVEVLKDVIEKARGERSRKDGGHPTFEMFCKHLAKSIEHRA